MAPSRIELFRAAIAADPSNELAQFSLAGELFEADQFAEALEHYRKALEAKADWMRVHIQIGKCCLELDRKDEARAALEQARAILERSADEENRGEIDELFARLD